MRPVYADFAAHPPRLGNAFAADGDQPWPTHHGDHAILGSGAEAVVGFDMDKGDQIEQLTLTVTALVSKRGPEMGYAPLTIDVNGHAVVERLTIPGGGDLPQSLAFAVPGDWLLPGQRNAVRVRSGQDAVTNLWLYRVTLEEVFDRGAAERAMAADAAREPVFTYGTAQRSPDEPGWTTGAPLRIYVDRGEQSLPAQLSWSRPDGFECAISFQSAMDGFSGYVRAADGRYERYEGSSPTARSCARTHSAATFAPSRPRRAGADAGTSQGSCGWRSATAAPPRTAWPGATSGATPRRST